MLNSFEHNPKMQEINDIECNSCIKDGDIDGTYPGTIEIRTTLSNNYEILNDEGDDIKYENLPNIFIGNINIDIRYRDSDNLIYSRIIGIQLISQYPNTRYKINNREVFGVKNSNNSEKMVIKLLATKNIEGKEKNRYSFTEIAELSNVSVYRISAINYKYKIR